MKKFFALFAAFLLLWGLVPASALGEAPRLHIVASTFPIYDWVRQLLGENADHAELTLLLDSGVDLHSFQPTVSDILTIASCDLFLYVGGESDAWVKDALRQSLNPDRRAISLLEALGGAAREEELVEGMEGEEDHDHDHDHDHSEDEEIEYDEHIWLSLRNAQALCRVIADALMALDPAHADTYAANLSAYTGRLAALDREYADMVSAAPIHTLLFGDRFPFRYLTEDYGLRYYAAFAGCSAETEASFQTIIFLAEKADALHLPAVLTIEGRAHRIAETVVENTAEKSQKVLILNSMQGTTGNDAADTTYLDIMESNLQVLRQALN